MRNGKISSLLVPFDFQEPSQAALRVAKKLAARWDAQIELLHIRAYPAVLTHSPIESEVSLIPQGPYIDDIKRELRSIVGDFPKTRIHVLEGNPEQLIKRLSIDASADLLVMGTHGYKGLDHLIENSVVEAVVRTTAVPVLSVHAKKKDFSPKKILCPINFTDQGGDGLAKACVLAREFGADLHLLHVVEPSLYHLASLEDIKAHLDRTASEIVGINVSSQIASGSPVDSILSLVETGEFDLIVLAAHRRYVWKEWMVGTTAERVLRHSPVPVFAVPCDAQQHPK